MQGVISGDAVELARWQAAEQEKRKFGRGVGVPSEGSAHGQAASEAP